MPSLELALINQLRKSIADLNTRLEALEGWQDYVHGILKELAMDPFNDTPPVDRAVVVTDAMVEAALDIINPHIIATKRIVSCDLMDRAIEAALRAAPAEAGVLLPEWVTNVEIELQGADPAWPSGTRMQEGIGPTIPAALADALKGRRKVSIGNGMDDKPDGGY